MTSLKTHDGATSRASIGATLAPVRRDAIRRRGCSLCVRARIAFAPTGCAHVQGLRRPFHAGGIALWTFLGVFTFLEGEISDVR